MDTYWKSPTHQICILRLEIEMPRKKIREIAFWEMYLNQEYLVSELEEDLLKCEVFKWN